MRVLAIVACFILFLDLSDCWARRRREQSTTKKREVSRVNGAGEVKVSLEQCEADIQACGFTVQCSCCNKPSFLGCGATGLIGSPSIQLLRTEKRDISDIGRDEAGCHLRSVLYDEKKICIPGNVASMFVIADQSSAGDCYPVFPLNCKNGLAESTVYYQYIYVPRDAVQVQRTLSALLAAGHFCQISEDETQGGIKCAI